MTMQSTKAHRNGPHRSRKSRRASAVQTGPAVQAEMFSVADDGGAVDGDGAGSRATDMARHADGPQGRSAIRHRAPFGSFARAKTQGDYSATALRRPARPTGREVVPDALGKLGLRRLGDSGGATASSVERGAARPDRGFRVGESAHEHLPPLVPFIVSTDRSRAPAPTTEGRFVVSAHSVSDPRIVTRPRSDSFAPHSLEPAMVATSADVRARPRAMRHTRRARLTTRGHVAVMVLVATAIAGASAMVNANHVAPIAGAQIAATQEVLVHSGDTVQSIASQFAPAAERADLVALIRAANGLSGAADAPLPAGEYVIVPTS